MQAPQDMSALFEELTRRYTEVIEKNYRWRYQRAKDKEFVKDELKRGLEFMVEFFPGQTEKLLKTYWEWYKRGEDFADIIAHLRKTYGEINDERPFKRVVNGKALTLYSSEEEKALKKLALNKRKLIKLLINYTAHKDIQKRFDSLFEENVKDEKEPTVKYPVKWTGKKDNKNDFVQLIYGLHKAGYINEGKGEITKITEALASVFDVKLGKGWQSNHSASINNASRYYEPAIFHKIQEAYTQHAEETRENKKKTR